MATTLALPYSSVLSVPSFRILGNDTGASRSAKGLTAAEVRAMLTVPTLAEVAAAYQPLDGDLTSIAALTTTTFGRGLLTLVDASAGRTSLDVYSTTQINASLATKADLVGGVIPSSQIPAIAITEYLGAVANQAAMLALNGDRGDWCLRSDLGTTWVLNADDSTLLASWTELNYPTAPVTSVNGETGAVSLSAADVGASALGHTHAFADLTSKPTTLSGYGISDAQPLDGDLTSLAGASGTNTIYYRSAANTWSAVTIGANLTFAGGTLAATGGGGGSPGGSNTQIQFNDGGAFAGASGLVWDKTNLRLALGHSSPSYAFDFRGAGGSGAPTVPAVLFECVGNVSTSSTGVAGVNFQNIDTTGTSSDFRFMVTAPNGDYVAVNMPGAGNNLTLFGRNRNECCGLLTTSTAGGRHLYVGTTLVKDVFVATNNIERLTVSGDGGVYGGSANRLEIRNGTNSQQLALFATWSSGTSFEALDFRYTSGAGRFEISPAVGSAGGTVRSLAIGMRNSAGSFTRAIQFASGGGITIAGTMTIEDGLNFVLNTTTGTKIATNVSQKLGFWNATPVVQPASANQAALSLDVDVTGGDTVDLAAVNANFAALQTLMNQLRSDLVSTGLIKGAA